MRRPHPREGRRLIRRRRLSFAVLLVCFALAGACSSDAGTTNSPTPANATSSAGPTAAGTSGPTADPNDLPAGRNYGYIKSFDTGAHTLSFDLAEFLTGDEADQAAEKDGVIASGEHIENDYYVRNKNKKLRTVSYESDVKIRIVNWADCCDLIDGELEPFAASFQAGADNTGKYHGPTSGYWLTVSDGTITLIEEQYVP